MSSVKLTISPTKHSFTKIYYFMTTNPDIKICDYKSGYKIMFLQVEPVHFSIRILPKLELPSNVAQLAVPPLHST